MGDGDGVADRSEGSLSEAAFPSLILSNPQRICRVVDAGGFLPVAGEACPAVMHPRRFGVLLSFQEKGFLNHFCV